MYGQNFSIVKENDLYTTTVNVVNKNSQLCWSKFSEYLHGIVLDSNIQAYLQDRLLSGMKENISEHLQELQSDGLINHFKIAVDYDTTTVMVKFKQTNCLNYTHVTIKFVEKLNLSKTKSRLFSINLT